MINLLKYEGKVLSKNKLIKTVFISWILYCCLFVSFCFYKDSNYAKEQIKNYAAELKWIDDKKNFLINEQTLLQDTDEQSIISINSEIDFWNDIKEVDKKILDGLQRTINSSNLSGLEIKRFEHLTQGKEKHYEMSYIDRRYKNDISTELNKLKQLKEKGIEIHNSPYTVNFFNILFQFNFESSFHLLLIAIIMTVFSSVVILKEYEEKTYTLFYTTGFSKKVIYTSKVLVSILISTLFALIPLLVAFIFGIFFGMGSLEYLFSMNNILLSSYEITFNTLLSYGVLAISIPVLCGLISGWTYSERIPIIITFIVLILSYYLPTSTITGYIPFSIIKIEQLIQHEFHYLIGFIALILMYLIGLWKFNHKRMDNKQ